MTCNWITQLAGRFIVFDGPDGSGKTTQFHRFAALARDAGVAVCEVREPGGTSISEKIRDILLDPLHEMMDVRCEMMLYMASRAQLMAERIAPALEQGELVLADRFVSSTLAYQGTAGGMSTQEILSVAKVAIGEHWPALVVIFDVDEAAAAHRLNPLLDRIEQKGSDYHGRVREGFAAQAAAEPALHMVIEARDDIETVFGRLCEGMRERMTNA